MGTFHPSGVYFEEKVVVYVQKMERKRESEVCAEDTKLTEGFYKAFPNEVLVFE